MWSAALLGAAGAYALHHRPVHARPEPRAIVREARPLPAQHAAPSENTYVTIAPVTIVGTPPPAHPATNKPAPKKPPHCSGWANLAQGPADGKVRICD
jgi:hypothetical protein